MSRKNCYGKDQYKKTTENDSRGVTRRTVGVLSGSRNSARVKWLSRRRQRSCP